MQYNTIKKYELFKNFVNQYATQEEFMQASTKIIDNILEYVSNKEIFDNFVFKNKIKSCLIFFQSFTLNPLLSNYISSFFVF